MIRDTRDETKKISVEDLINMELGVPEGHKIGRGSTDNECG
jgi:hypothetical protein